MERMDTIRRVREAAFWEHLTVGEMERVREELRGLAKYVFEGTKRLFDVDIEDEVTETGESPVVTFEPYRKRVADYLKANRGLPVVKKIKHLQPLDAKDMATLEHLLWEEIGSKEEYERQTREMPYGASVAAFVRTIVCVGGGRHGGGRTDRALCGPRELDGGSEGIREGDNELCVHERRHHDRQDSERPLLCPPPEVGAERGGTGEKAAQCHHRADSIGRKGTQGREKDIFLHGTQ